MGSIKAMFVLDGDTNHHPWQNDHQACRLASGWDWLSDYDAAGGSFDTNAVYTAMEKRHLAHRLQLPIRLRLREHAPHRPALRPLAAAGRLQHQAGHGQRPARDRGELAH